MEKDKLMTGCAICPVKMCDTAYRGSHCAAYRNKAGVDFDPITNAETLAGLDEDNIRKALIEYFCHWASCGDSYIFDLTKEKEAFAVGTMHLDDFVEWDENRIIQLVDEFIAWLKEPALNKKG